MTATLIIALAIIVHGFLVAHPDRTVEIRDVLVGAPAATFAEARRRFRRDEPDEPKRAPIGL